MKRDSKVPDLTDDEVLSAMDPNGATMEYGEIVAQLESQLPYGGYVLYRAADRTLQRMKRGGKVELVMGAGAGWRIVGCQVVSGPTDDQLEMLRMAAVRGEWGYGYGRGKEPTGRRNALTRALAIDIPGVIESRRNIATSGVLRAYGDWTAHCAKRGDD